ncbi:MAG: sugar ABC transporter permease [Ruminococcaceae bacterium]|nr:sugar ABC transporter permease [Oscillospiraceae bacterium]
MKKNEPVMSKSRKMRRLKENATGWFFISPVVIGVLVFTAYPMIMSFVYSLCNYDSITPMEFIGFQNYIDMFQDELVWYSLRLTFRFALISVVVNMILSIGFALLMNFNIKGITVFRILAILPCLMPGAASAIVWKDMMSPTANGRFNQLLTALGFEPFPFLIDPDTALFSMFFMGLWGLGGGMLMWLASLRGISPTLYEAARLDGASKWQQLIKITLPMLTPMIFYQLITSVIGSMQAFGSSMLMTGGGPLNSTYFFGLLIYNTGLKEMNMGYSCAMAWFLFAIIVVLTLFIFKRSKWVYYGEEQ